MEYKEKLELAKNLICKNKEAAIQILSTLAEEGINDKELYLELGKCYIEDDREKAIKNIEKYMEAGGDNPEVKILLSKLYRSKGYFEKSKEIINGIKDNFKDKIIEEFYIRLSEKKYAESLILIKKIPEGENLSEYFDDITDAGLKSEQYEFTEKILNKYNAEQNKKHYCLYRVYRQAGNIEKKIREMSFIFKIKEYFSEIKYELIKECRKDLSFIEKDYIYTIIEMLCVKMEEDDTDTDVINGLAVILRNNIHSEIKRNRITEILKKYHKISRKPRVANIFLNETEILERKTVLKSRPRHITVQLTTSCNLKCPMCCVYENNYVINDTIYRFIKDSIPYLESVIWQGGEAFLYENFDELIELAGHYGVRQSILTNGLLLNKKRIEILSKYNIKIKISIDAVDKKKYEEIRKGGKYEDLLKVLDMLEAEKEKNPKFGYMMATVVNSLNYRNLKEITDFAVKHKFECISFQNFIINSVSQTSLECLNDEQAKEVLNFFKNLKREESELPIKIETNFSLDNTEDLVRSYRQYNFMKELFEKSLIKKRYNIYKKDSTNTKKQKQLMCIHSWALDKTFNPLIKHQKLFCATPWTKLYFDINDIMRSACNGYTIDISKASKDDIWNNKKLVEYRKEISNNSLNKCNVICRNSGEYGIKTRLGIQ